MNSSTFVVLYVKACATGPLAIVDCGPVWQCTAIAVLLFLALGTFLRLVATRHREEIRAAAG